MKQWTRGQGRKNTQKEQEKEKRLRKNEEAIREIQDNMKHNNIHIIGIPEGEEEEQGFEKVMMENFPILMREKVTQIQETQRVSRGNWNQEEPREAHPRHNIIKMAKFQDKERILKVERDEQEVTYKGTPKSLAADFSMETPQARREWQEIFQTMRITGLQPRLLYPTRLSIKIEGQIRSFPD